MTKIDMRSNKSCSWLIGSVLCFLSLLYSDAAQSSTLRKIPIGIANRNPGNLIPVVRGNWKAWRGAIGVDGYGHLIFSDVVFGLRAIKVNLQIYQKKHHIRTITGIVKRWLPETDTIIEHALYVNSICENAGRIDPFEKLNFSDKETGLALCHAIVFYEEGQDPYSDEQYEKAWQE